MRQPASSRRRPNSSPKGKIASLTYEVREELCNRMRDGARGPALLKWLAEVAPEKRISANNLSNWRLGGYKTWLSHQDRLQDIRDRAETTRRELEAGGFSVLDKTIYELAGRLADAEIDPTSAAAAVAALKQAVTGGGRLQVAERRAKLAEEALDLERQKFAAAQARAAQADRAEGVVRDEALSPEEKQMRIREIFGLA